MPVTFNVPKQKAKSVYNISEFKGVDLTNSPTNVDDNKSPNAINMIRDVPGKVRKRMGYEVVENWDDDGRYVENYLDLVPKAEAHNTWTVSTQSEKQVRITGTSDFCYPHFILNDNINSTSETVYVQAGTYVLEYIRTSESYPTVGTVPSDPLRVYWSIDIYKTDDPYAEQGRYLGDLVLGNSYNEDFDVERVSKTITLDYGCYLRFNMECSIEAPTSYSQEAPTYTFNGVTFGLNLVKQSEYTENMPYIPYGDVTPTTLNINGCHFRREDEYPLYHIGTKIYKNGVRLYSGANDTLSHSWQFDDSLFIMDGKKFLVYDGTTLQPVENIAYIPTVSINRDPIWAKGGGGGVEYESFNLLQPKWTETFVVTEKTKTSTQFPLTFGDLDNTPVQAWLLNNQGQWVEKYETTDFTVNRTTGVITFNTAPGESPLNGEDNVKITASRSGVFEEKGYPDRINKCTFGMRFGVNGAADRMFVSGNPDFPNADWYSGHWDPTYFPDVSYALLGSSKSAVVGYSIVSNYLAAHKDELEDDMSIIVREGNLITDDNGIDKPSFRIINTLQGAGAIASNSFAYLCTEPIFLTRSGLYAVTAQDITGEKYAQSRSFYLNGKLTKEEFSDLQNSFAIIHNDMYILCVNHDTVDEQGNPYVATRMYILDGLQAMRTDKSEPYSTRQYAAFYCEAENVNCMWERENRLYFGTTTGKVCRFFNDKNDIHSYNDDGKAIYAQWETPDIDGQLFYKNKTLRYIALRAGAAIATSVEIWGMDRGIWKFIKQDNTFGRYLSFQNLQFSKFSFSGSKEQRISRTKVRIKKVDKYRLRFINRELNEPFTLYDLANEYIENGNYKG